MYSFSLCQTGVATVADGIPDGWMGLDAGEESITQFCAAIEKAQTIVWNGPVGVFEFDTFAKGSRAVLDSIVMATERGATSIIGMLMATAAKQAVYANSSENLLRLLHSSSTFRDEEGGVGKTCQLAVSGHDVDSPSPLPHYLLKIGPFKCVQY